jgi:hypothetical protein
MSQSESTCFQLSFRSLFNSGRGYAFPCNERGQVDLLRLSKRAYNNYLFARGMVGRDFLAPAVEKIAPAAGLALSAQCACD